MYKWRGRRESTHPVMVRAVPEVYDLYTLISEATGVPVTTIMTAVIEHAAGYHGAGDEWCRGCRELGVIRPVKYKQRGPIP